MRAKLQAGIDARSRLQETVPDADLCRYVATFKPAFRQLAYSMLDKTTGPVESTGRFTAPITLKWLAQGSNKKSAKDDSQEKREAMQGFKS